MGDLRAHGEPMPSLKRPDPAKPAPTLKPMEDTRLRRVIRLADAIRLLGYAESHADA